MKKPKLTSTQFNTVKNGTMQEAAEIIAESLHDYFCDLVDSDQISSLTGATNASGWMLDTLEVDPNSIDRTTSEISATIHFQYAGDQDEDAAACGDSISGDASVTIDKNGSVDVDEIDPSLDNWM